MSNSATPLTRQIVMFRSERRNHHRIGIGAGLKQPFSLAEADPDLLRPVLVSHARRVPETTEIASGQPETDHPDEQPLSAGRCLHGTAAQQRGRQQPLTSAAAVAMPPDFARRDILATSSWMAALRLS